MTNLDGSGEGVTIPVTKKLKHAEKVAHIVDPELLEFHGLGYQENMRESFKKLIELHPILTR